MAADPSICALRCNPCSQSASSAQKLSSTGSVKVACCSRNNLPWEKSQIC